MAHLLLFCLASVGLTAILVDGSIFIPLRRYFSEEADRIRQRRERKGRAPSLTLFEAIHEILTCYQCCGFWAGVFCSPLLISSASSTSLMKTSFVNGLPNSVFVVFCGGFAASLLAILYMRVLECVYSYTIFVQRSMPLPPAHEEVHRELEPEEA